MVHLSRNSLDRGMDHDGHHDGTERCTHGLVVFRSEARAHGVTPPGGFDLHLRVRISVDLGLVQPCYDRFAMVFGHRAIVDTKHADQRNGIRRSDFDWRRVISV